MLITKEVEVIINGSNMKHYQDKGYLIPKAKDKKGRLSTPNGTKILVKVNDLNIGSHTIVNVRCDGCGEILHIEYRDYYKRINKHKDVCYCQKCSNNFITKCKTHETILNNSISFAENGINIYGKDFLEKYWDYDKNGDLNPWNILYSTPATKVWIKCQNTDYHDSYEVTPNYFSKFGYGCPYCTNRHGKVHMLDSLGTLYPEVIDIWSNNNKFSPYEVSPSSSKKVFWKCKESKHEEYERSINKSQRFNFRCPECSQERLESLLQEKVRLYMEKNYSEYKLNHEYNCTLIVSNPKFQGKSGDMPFDNELILNNIKLIIEVHGIQHYKICGFHYLQAKRNNTTPEQELLYQQWKDKYKKDYALSQGYFYLEIPYWTEKDGSYKTLINNIIKDILHIKITS